MKTSPKIKKASSLPPAMPGGEKAGTNFMEVVYRIVRRIPKGRATSYGAIAEASGIRLTARMVGWAMNAGGRAQPPVPAHRVVNSKGELSGRSHFSTPTLMQELLEQEGIRVKNDKIEDFNRVFWDPADGNKTTVKPKAAVKPAAAKTRVKEKSRPASVSASRVRVPPAPKAESASIQSNSLAAAAKPGAKTTTQEKGRTGHSPISASRTKAKPAPKAKSPVKPTTAPPAAKRKTAAKPATAKTPGRPAAPKIKKEK